jgi:hypothetical protein
MTQTKKYAYISVEATLRGTVLYWVIESNSYNPHVKCYTKAEAERWCKRIDKRRNAEAQS